ncbi:MAG: hypothetical protein KDA91_20570 [Planctomycetaceae bacterium]|nr:hypothetical protein [Planctomycetaceae bacterium]
MREPVITTKGSRSRRTIATLTWSGLTLGAAFLWYGRAKGMPNSSIAEPVAFLLAAYATLSSIFAWMLYSPNRRSSEQSPALFLSAAFTLLPPCIIAFCLLPPESAFRGWLTLGVFCLAMLAVTTPVPQEFFAVPRDRATYLRPISNAAFAGLTIHNPATSFEALTEVPARRQTQPRPTTPAPTSWPTDGRDPWQDPFYGTGIAPVVAGARARRRNRSSNGTAEKNVSETHPGSARYPSNEEAVHKTGSTTSVQSGLKSPSRPIHTKQAYPPAAPFGFRPPEAGSAAPEVTRSPRSEQIDRDAVNDSAFADWGTQDSKTQDLKSIAQNNLASPVTGGAAAFERESFDSESHRGSTRPGIPDGKTVVPERRDPPPVTPEQSQPRELRGVDDQLLTGIHFERMTDEYGSEMVEGTARVNFLAGQKKANVHVPFSPPLPGIPEVECEAVGSDVLRLKVPVRQSYGIRIEARRSDAAEPLETEIGFAAVYSSPNRTPRS